MYRAVQIISKEVLELLYVKEKWTLRDIASYFGCSVDTIVRRMESYDIERRKTKKDISKEELCRTYYDNKGHIQSVADSLGVSMSTVTNRLREYGLYRKPVFKQSVVDPERIQKAYESGNSTTDIAKMMGLTRWKVLHILRKMNVSIRGRKRRLQPIEEMAYLYTEHHMSTKDIGLAYGLQSNTIALYLREEGVSLRGKTLNIDEKEIQRLRGEGFSVAAIARQMNCSISAVRRRLKF
ncbi:helix-turn-helix domain-containing protein [Veillonella agrestimuris]|uniref:helix-turn-helix domain-containing protein n=1 Tax=Veillonella agrestimuris TaxID=2941340 RepID=UPI00204003E9|nr:sortase [Veillonella agrestimuris]